MPDRIAPQNGLLVFDKRLSLPDVITNIGGDDTDSSYTQTGSSPGFLQTTGKSLVPLVSNAQGSDTITVEVGRGGFPGRAGIVYSFDGGITERGWNPPTAVRTWEPIVWTTASTYSQHSSVVIPRTQNIVTIFCSHGSPGIYCTIRDATSWTTPDLISTSVAYTLQVVLLPNGNLLLITTDHNDQFRTYGSANDGATWGVVATPDDLNMTLPSQCIRMTACMIGDDVAIVMKTEPLGANPGDIYQYASADYGASIDYVGTRAYTGAPGNMGHHKDELIDCGDHALMVILDRETKSKLSYRLLTNAYQAIEDAPFSTFVAANTAIDTGTGMGIAGVRDHDGTYYVACSHTNTGGNVKLSLFSTQDIYAGEWKRVEVYNSNDPITGYKESIDMVAATGRIFVMGTHNANPGNEDGSISMVKLSNFSNVEVSAEPFHTLVPFDLPEDVGWTHTSTGGVSPTININGAFSYITTAQTNYDTYTGTIRSLRPGAQFQMRSISGGSPSSSHIAFRLVACDTTDTYSTIIRVHPTGFSVFDVTSGVVYATVSRVMTNMTDFLIHYGPAKGKVTAYYKPETAIDWIKVVDNADVASTGVGSAAWQATMGHLTSGTASSGWTNVTLWQNIGDVLEGNTLRGKVLTSKPYPIAGNADADGKTMFLSLRGGLAVSGENYSIKPTFRYGIANAFPGVSPSPYKSQWRTINTGEQNIVFNLKQRTTLGGAVGVFFGNINFNEAMLEYFNGTTWVTAGTLNAAADSGSSLLYTRTGDTLLADTGSPVSARYIQPGELVGGSVKLAPGVFRRIVSNTGGWWSADSSVLQCSVRIDVDGSEPATGTCSLNWPNAVLLAYQAGSEQIRQYWRIRIPNQGTPEGYFQVGTLGIGQLIPFGKAWGWGWSSETTPNFDTFTDSTGTESRTKQGRPKTNWSFSFADGINNLNWRKNTPDNTAYVGFLGTSKLAAKDSTYPQLMDIINNLTDSYSTPVVAMSSVANGTIVDPTLYLYGYLDGSVGSSVVSGNEGVNEVIRVETVQVQGIV